MNSTSDCVAVGVSTSYFQSDRRMPGWDGQSYGYHGDDGGIFHDSGRMERPFGPEYGPGDTIGCGLDYVRGGIFFTLNGDFLGYGWIGVDFVHNPDIDLYPTVGVDTNCPLACNYGERPFMFDLEGFVGRYRRHQDLVERGLSGLSRRREAEVPLRL